jgi:hypothetical protein
METLLIDPMFAIAEPRLQNLTQKWGGSVFKKRTIQDLKEVDHNAVR